MPAYRRLFISAVMVSCALAGAGSASAATGEQTPLHVPATSTQAPSTSIGFVRMMIVLGFFAVLLFAARFMLKRAQRGRAVGGGPGAGIAVLATTPIAANRSLHVIRVGGKNLLVGATDGGINRIASLSDDDVAALVPDEESGAGRLSFSSALASAAQNQFGKQRPGAQAMPRPRSLTNWIRERTVR